MLGKIPVPGRPANLIIVGQGPIVLAVGGWGLLGHFFCLIYQFLFLSPSLSLFLPLSGRRPDID